MNGRVQCAVLGSGNIGTDLMAKLLCSETLELTAVVGVDPDSARLARARAQGLDTSAEGVDWLVEHADQAEIVFEATSASAHRANAPRLHEAGLRSIDLTPAKLGPGVVPVVNLEQHADAPDVNLISCGGQATIPVVAAVSQVTPVPYAEIVAAIASKSAGPGTRQSIDEFTRTTAKGLEEIGGAERGKAIIILNPAEPPILMRNTIFCTVGPDVDRDAIAASILAMAARVATYVPGYRLRADPIFDEGRVMPFIEVSHGDGLGGSSLNYGVSVTDEMELIAAAADVIEHATLAALLLPGIGTRDELSEARELGVGLIRIATHCTEADIAEQHIATARELGLTAVGFLMMAHMAEPQVLAEQARIMAAAGAQVVYVTDSAGALMPPEVAARVGAIRAALPEEAGVGFHGHQNLSLGVANSLAAIDAGASWIDCCTCGLGAGAGNTPTEIFAAVCDRAGVKTGVDTFALMDVAEDVVRPLLPRPQVVDRAALLLGYAGVYSSFLLHAERASERFGVSTKDILVELGRRKAVGGQEDWIIDVAAELSAAAV